MSLGIFFTLAAALIASALGVVLSRNPIRSALSLVMTLFLLAVTFVLLDAHLVAALQIVVYAGAIMVLFLFVIMLLNLQQDPHEHVRVPQRAVSWLLAAGVSLALIVVIWRSRTPAPESAASLPVGFGSAAALSDRLFTHFVLPFEITSILLLVAMVGAVVLARRRLE